MKNLIISLFGVYEPVSVLLDDGSTSYLNGIGSLDIPWLAGYVLFVLFVSLISKFVFVVLNK